MSHALEADHLAAVGAMATSKQSSTKGLIALGASWGMGHTTTLMLLSSVVLVFGFVLSERMAAGLELFVGLLLVGLGAQVFWKIRKAKMHFHVHRHDDGKQHIHAHSHAGERTQAGKTHKNVSHAHRHGFSVRAYFVGLAHGAAGSAGLVALTAAATRDGWTALLYVGVFGLGSVLGMALLTYAVSWPLRLGEKSLGRAFSMMQGAIACIAIFIGCSVIIETAPLVMGNG